MEEFGAEIIKNTSGKKCPDCNGSGKGWDASRACSACAGTGTIEGKYYVCSDCVHEVSPNARKCPKCGKSFEGVICGYCSFRNDSKKSECQKCGEPFK